MANMSYCRFENTARDLSDCEDALEAILSQDTESLGSALSEDEVRAAGRLIAMCARIVARVAEQSPGAFGLLGVTSEAEHVVAGACDAIEENGPDFILDANEEFKTALAEESDEA